MIPGPLLAVLGVISWVSAFVLVRAALPRPRIGALTERAIIAVVIALFVTVYALAALNTDAHFPFFDTDTVRFIVRIFVVILGLLPAWWTFLWLTGRLGESGHG